MQKIGTQIRQIFADNILEICVIDFITFSESVEICEIRGLKVSSSLSSPNTFFKFVAKLKSNSRKFLQSFFSPKKKQYIRTVVKFATRNFFEKK